MKIVFTLIASRDADFFLAVAEKIKSYGYSPSFISFYEPSCAQIENLGYEVLNVHYQNKISKFDQLIKINDYEILNKVSIIDIILHEKLTYKISNDKALINKLLNYDLIISNWLKKIAPNIVIQELGGFIAPLTLYHSCMRDNIKHIFIEPMLYKGTLGFVENSLNYKIDISKDDLCNVRNVENYIHYYNANQTLIMPKKDAHHFTGGSLWSILNLYNLKKLKIKIYIKYINKMGQEYDKIFIYTASKLFSAFNFLTTRIFYFSPNFISKCEYYYYPFHVPLDIQLTVRSPKWLDQLGLLIEIANKLPNGAELWIKEHPACVGSYSLLKLFPLLNKKNVRLINPKINSFNLIKNSKGVITINSKVGMEAIMQDKPVFVFGDTCYNQKYISIGVDSVNELIGYISSEIDFQTFTDSRKRKLFLSSLYAHSYPGELYDNSIENINDFLEGLLKALHAKNKLKYEV